MTREIASVAIHPAIGIARVGNSPDKFFYGPEVPGVKPVDSDQFRDSKGRIKRQAARFRIYGLDDRGQIVRELTAKDASITWTVHIANAKPGWYLFDRALDIPTAAKIANARRNPTIKGDDRRQLIIDPGPRSISGPAVNTKGDDARYAFDTGEFFGKKVYLGELRTDDDGRLVFLGGRGDSAPRNSEPINNFSDNDGWHDDVSDGFVDATVRIGDTTLQATGAWVVVGPPDYAPGIQAIVTGYDLAFEAATKIDASFKPARPSFAAHILPLLTRMVEYQWVNAGYFEEFGWGAPSDFTQSDLLTRLSDSTDQNRPLRVAVFSRFRDAAYKSMQSGSWPYIYGDDVTLDMNKANPREWMAVLPIQYEWLRKWADGDFVPGVKPTSRAAPSPQEEPLGLDRAALENTIGGPFHPGCEFTWPMRLPLLYEAPFRIRRRNGSEPDWGDQMTQNLALSASGPLAGSGPGSLSRWMACPWQADTSSCLSAYRPFSGEYTPTFWPARVPNDVLPKENYDIVVDKRRQRHEREDAMAAGRRRKWLRGIVYPDQPRMVVKSPNPQEVFVSAWPKVGIVTQMDGPGDPGFPDTFWVETGRSLEPLDQRAKQVVLQSIFNENPNDER
jgi:L-Lysine epsilon oxidase N-terminal/L-lysine epsilon oxidase C-terminal domain